MSRFKKNKIKTDLDSVTSLLQEIYNDCLNLQKKAQSDITERKLSLKVDGVHETSQLGKVNNESMKIIDAAIEKKILVAKLQAQIALSKTSGDNTKAYSNEILSDDDKKELRNMVKKIKHSDSDDK